MTNSNNTGPQVLAAKTAAKAEGLFLLYASMPPDTRSVAALVRLAHTLGIAANKRTVDSWSRRYGWQARLNTIPAVLVLPTETIQAMNQRQASLGYRMQEVAQGRLDAMEPNELTPDQAARLAREGSSIERLARGEATSRQEVAVAVMQPVIDHVVELFLEVNVLADPQQRAERFAEAFDRIAVGALEQAV